MLTQNESVRIFAKNMDELINCQYVLSPKKISNLLKDISVSKLFYELFDFCTSDFNYAQAKKKYFTTTTAYGKRFYLPPDSKTIIALGFSLLYSIDAKEEDFSALLNEYFYASNVNGAYKRFANEFLLPFKNQVIAVAVAMIKSKREEPVATVKSPLNKTLLSDKDISMIKDLLEQSKGVILQYKIEPELKSELITLYDGFLAALYDVDPQNIKVTYLGYKYGILFHKKHDSGLEKVEAILKRVGIL